MKKYLFLLLLITFSKLSVQSATCESTSKNSITDVEPQKEELIKISEVSRYRLYPTQNTFNFLKLDTRTGVITRVQWSLESGNRFENVVNSEHLINYNHDEVINGRFEITPTENFYNFLLLDKINGRVWQCQWNFDVDKNFIIRIY